MGAILYNADDGLITGVLDLGEEMLKCGAEVSRVEDTLQRIFKSYGAADVDVLTITSCIILTVTEPDGTAYTQTRRVKTTNIDFDRLSELNALSRLLCASCPAPAEIRERLERISGGQAEGEKKADSGGKPAFFHTPGATRLLKKCAGSICAAGGFAVFFGGSAADFAAASVVALFIAAFETLFRKNNVNLPSYYFACTFCAGALTLLLCALFRSVGQGSVLIGMIMLVIPGLAFTNSARDILLGDTISGSLRLLESVLYAACIAGGVAAALLLFGGAAI